MKPVYTTAGFSEWLRNAPVGASMIMLREPKMGTNEGLLKHGSIVAVCRRMGIIATVTRVSILPVDGFSRLNGAMVSIVNKDGYKDKQKPKGRPKADVS